MYKTSIFDLYPNLPAFLVAAAVVGGVGTAVFAGYMDLTRPATMPAAIMQKAVNSPAPGK